MAYGTGLHIEGTEAATRKYAEEQDGRFRLAMVQAHPVMVERLVRSRGYKTDAERRKEASDAFNKQFAEHRRRAKIERIEERLSQGSESKEAPKPAQKKAKPRPSWREIVRQVASKHNVTFEAIIGCQRHKPLVIARHEAFYRLSQETRFSLVKIGHKMQRDHTTIMFGIRRHKERMEAGDV